MDLKPINLANYYLTEDGVISKLDTYWDKLREITFSLEKLTRNMVRFLFNNLTISLLCVILIFWLDWSKTLSIGLLSLVTLGASAWSAFQWSGFLEFNILKKRGMVLYNALSSELEWNEMDYDLEDLPLEERILLSNFHLASQMPLNTFLYLFFVLLAPIINITFLGFFYFYA